MPMTMTMTVSMSVTVTMTTMVATSGGGWGYMGVQLLPTEVSLISGSYAQIGLQVRRLLGQKTVN